MPVAGFVSAHPFPSSLTPPHPPLHAPPELGMLVLRSQPLSGRFMLAAAGTGVLEAIAYCPLELVKTRMQVSPLNSCVPLCLFPLPRLSWVDLRLCCGCW